MHILLNFKTIPLALWANMLHQAPALLEASFRNFASALCRVSNFSFAAYNRRRNKQNILAVFHMVKVVGEGEGVINMFSMICDVIILKTDHHFTKTCSTCAICQFGDWSRRHCKSSLNLLSEGSRLELGCQLSALSSANVQYLHDHFFEANLSQLKVICVCKTRETLTFCLPSQGATTSCQSMLTSLLACGIVALAGVPRRMRARCGRTWPALTDSSSVSAPS